jgi:hypothetical protein
MRGDQFEKVFGEFLESEAYEEAEGALFDFARAAYQAGWLAAGGEPPAPKKAVPFPRSPET